MMMKRAARGWRSSRKQAHAAAAPRRQRAGGQALKRSRGTHRVRMRSPKQPAIAIGSLMVDKGAQPGEVEVHTLPVDTTSILHAISAMRDNWPTWCARCATGLIRSPRPRPKLPRAMEICPPAPNPRPVRCRKPQRRWSSSPRPCSKTPPMPGARTNWRARRRTWRCGGEVVHGGGHHGLHRTVSRARSWTSSA